MNNNFIYTFIKVNRIVSESVCIIFLHENIQMLLESLISEHSEIDFVGQARRSFVDSSVFVVISLSVVVELVAGSVVVVALGAVSALAVGCVDVGHVDGFVRPPRWCTSG